MKRSQRRLNWVKQVEIAVDSVLDMIAESLRSNERVGLRGFGSFVVKDKKERQGRNPRTVETITIPAKRDASFRPGKDVSMDDMYFSPSAEGIHRLKKSPCTSTKGFAQHIWSNISDSPSRSQP
jgi:integration host factor subunit beta